MSLPSCLIDSLMLRNNFLLKLEGIILLTSGFWYFFEKFKPFWFLSLCNWPDFTLEFRIFITDTEISCFGASMWVFNSCAGHFMRCIFFIFKKYSVFFFCFHHELFVLLGAFIYSTNVVIRVPLWVAGCGSGIVTVATPVAAMVWVWCLALGTSACCICSQNTLQTTKNQNIPPPQKKMYLLCAIYCGSVLGEMLAVKHSLSQLVSYWVFAIRSLIFVIYFFLVVHLIIYSVLLIEIFPWLYPPNLLLIYFLISIFLFFVSITPYSLIVPF